MPHRLIARAKRAAPVAHIYAASPDGAEGVLAAVADVAPGIAVQIHIEGAETRGGASRPVLMALLADAEPGDLVCGSAAAFSSAPPRARSRLMAVVKARGVGLALIGNADSMAQLALGVALEISMQAVAQTMTPRAASLARAAPSAGPGVDVETRVLQLLNHGHSWRQVQTQLGAPRAVIARCAKRLAAVESAQSHAAFATSRAAGLSASDRADDGDADITGAGPSV